MLLYYTTSLDSGGLISDRCSVQRRLTACALSIIQGRELWIQRFVWLQYKDQYQPRFMLQSDSHPCLSLFEMLIDGLCQDGVAV